MSPMASATSTVTTARSQDANTPRLRVDKDSTATNPVDVKPIEHSEDDHFFWTCTEEPHRTRRMAIIKAHPEVLDDPTNPSILITNNPR